MPKYWGDAAPGILKTTARLGILWSPSTGDSPSILVLTVKICYSKIA